MFKGKTVLTGIKPTGIPHLGNMVGAIQPIIKMSNEAMKSYVFIADLHALNAVRDKNLIDEWSSKIAATFLALGLNTDNTIFFRQSDVPEVYQLTVLLANVTSKGLMNRAHAYKAAVEQNLAGNNDPDAGINMGLYTYPILMAADILLYQADAVPVGADQKQHVEMARDIAESFNRIYNQKILVVPEPVISKAANAIPGLDGRKMSKSYNNCIPIFAESAQLKNLIMKIVTDSKRPEEAKDPEQSAIFQIYSHITSKDKTEAMRQQFIKGGLGYKDAKIMLFEAMEAFLMEPREKYFELLAKPKDLNKILLDGADKARLLGRKTLDKVSKVMLGKTIRYGNK